MDTERKLRLVIDNKEPAPKPFIHPNFFLKPEEHRPIGNRVKQDILDKTYSVQDAFTEGKWFLIEGRVDFVYLPIEQLPNARVMLCMAYALVGDKKFHTIVLPITKECQPVNTTVNIEIENVGPPLKIG